MNARIAESLRAAFANSLESMTGSECEVTADAKAADAELPEPLLWEQSLSGLAAPCLWVSAGGELWREAGRMTLAALGVDSVTDEDCRSTWGEIVSQTVGGFCTAISAETDRGITAGKSQEAGRAPDDVHWVGFTVSNKSETIWIVRIGWSSALTALLSHKDLPAVIPPANEKAFSRTFDLLMDVPLPVSVSFGRTSLELREVLKLNTGSIVELNRFVAEPVEVMVNDCVIARGEVVVVEGNYGVRITQLSSREDRLKFGMAETSTRFGTPLR